MEFVQMEFVQNFPCFSIMLCMFAGIISSAFKEKIARLLNIIVLVVNIVLSAAVLLYTVRTGESYVYVMGRFPAPWGNEIRVGILEALMAVFFSLIMILSILGGGKYILSDIIETKQNLFYVLINLMMSSLLALIYTNDLFTAYVFIEFNTIAAG